MKLSQFKFNLPEELIASHPKENRDEAKMMVVNREKGTIEHRIFKDILEYFSDGDAFVINNTKVFPARLFGEKEKTGAKIEVFLLRELDKESRLWDVLVDPARKIRIGNKLYFGEDESLVAEVIDNTTSRGRTLRFLFDGSYDEFKKTIKSLGETPLPKIHNRPTIPEDEYRYQTIYAKHEGAIAAPTAGMHFSKILMKQLEIKGVNFAEITLHPGLGNFRPIEVEDLSKLKVDSEELFVTAQAAKIINDAKNNKHRVCAVGTTSMKALETAVSITGGIKPYSNWTNKFIFPPYEFKTADALITNFHLPMSPMLMMVSAYLGYDFQREVYAAAIKKKYKFFTYGDALLII